MGKNDKAFSDLVSGALSGDKAKMQKALDSIKITDADIAKSAHKWALEHGFEYDDDNGWYYSKHMPPVDADHIKGIYGLVLQERSDARLSNLQMMYMAGFITKAVFDLQSNPLALVKPPRLVKKGSHA